MLATNIVVVRYVVLVARNTASHTCFMCTTVLDKSSALEWISVKPNKGESAFDLDTEKHNKSVYAALSNKRNECTNPPFSQIFENVRSYTHTPFTWVHQNWIPSGY